MNMKLSELLLSKLLNICKILYNCSDVVKCLKRLYMNYDVMNFIINKAVAETCREAKLNYEECLDQIEFEIDQELVKEKVVTYVN